MQKFIGTGVALVTPFSQQLAVDFQGLKELLEHIMDSQVRYLVVHGSTGEAATTTSSEKQEVLTFIQRHNAKKLPIVYGWGGNDTRAMLQELEDITFQGVDAVMVASPYYNKPSQEGIEKHYTLLADACPVPVLLYNVPARTGSNIEAATTLQLSQHPNIIGIKEASGDITQCIEIAQNKPDDFLLISGDDLLTLPLMAMGGAGVITTVGNVMPKAMSNMVELASQGNLTEARAYMQTIWPACEFIGQAGNPVGTKQLLSELNLCGHYVRLPLVGPSSIPTPDVSF